MICTNIFEMNILSLNNSADKPGPVKKAVTPQHRKALNRPRRRLLQVKSMEVNNGNSGENNGKH